MCTGMISSRFDMHCHDKPSFSCAQEWHADILMCKGVIRRRLICTGMISHCFDILNDDKSSFFLVCTGMISRIFSVHRDDNPKF